MDWQRRNEGKLAVGVVAFMVVTLVAVVAWAGGLNATFTESRFDCPDDPSLVACYKSDVTGANALIDRAENLLIDRVEFDDWTEAGTCAVTADQWRNPVDGTVDADYLDNTGGANTDYRENDTGEAADVFHTGSVWVRSDYVHTITIQLYEDGVGEVDHFDFVAGNVWRRIPVDGVSVTGGDLMFRVFPGEMGVSTGTAYFYGGQLVANDEYLAGMGIFINPVDQAINKPRLDGTHANNPTTAFSHAQDQGNKLPAREYDGVNQLYSDAHDASMNVFDGDMTLTMFLERDADDAGEAIAFCHGNTNNDGFYLQASVPLGQWIAQFCQNADCTGPTVTVTTNDGMYHIVQVVREDDIATITVDGVESAGVDVTGYGIDANRALYIGAYDGAALHWDGQISHTVLRSRALSVDERAAEREDILGIVTNWSDVNAWEFERSTTAYKMFSAGGANALVSHMSEVAVDHPRMAGKGGGVRIEGPSTNLAEYSQQFQQAGSWAQDRVSIVADSIIALDGTITADTLHEDGTAAQTHMLRQSVTTVSGSVYTMSVYAMPINRDWILLASITDADGVYCDTATCTNGTVFGVATGQAEWMPDGWCRCSATWTSSTTGANSVRIFIGEADNSNNFDGLDQDSLYIWNAQFEEQPFPTSPILTLASPVTRTADDMTIDPHPAGTNNYILPEEFAPNTNADKLTMYGEFKCEWSDNTDIGSTQRSLIEISGNTGTAGQQRNRAWFEVTQTGELYGYLRDDSSTAHYVDSAVNPVDYSDWFSVRLVLDFTDLTRMDMWIAQPPNTTESNAGMAYTANTGAVSFDTTNTLIRIGQQYNDIIESFCHNRSLRINGQEIRP